ncbi:MAG: hypothetical protein ACL93V_15875 [Candidatus Electrothrix sp. YB6]
MNINVFLVNQTLVELNTYLRKFIFETLNKILDRLSKNRKIDKLVEFNVSLGEKELRVGKDYLYSYALEMTFFERIVDKLDFQENAINIGFLIYFQTNRDVRITCDIVSRYGDYEFPDISSGKEFLKCKDKIFQDAYEKFEFKVLEFLSNQKGHL